MEKDQLLIFAELTHAGPKNFTALSQELSYSAKPEIDLLSWASLGGNAKSSRTERKPKRTWRRAAR